MIFIYTSSFTWDLLKQCCLDLHGQVSKPPSPPIPVFDCYSAGTYRHMPIMNALIHLYI